MSWLNAELWGKDCILGREEWRVREARGTEAGAQQAGPGWGGKGTRTYLHVRVRFFHMLPLRAYRRRRRLTSPATPSTSGREQRRLRMVAIVSGSVGEVGGARSAKGQPALIMVPATFLHGETDVQRG